MNWCECFKIININKEKKMHIYYISDNDKFFQQILEKIHDVTFLSPDKFLVLQDELSKRDSVFLIEEKYVPQQTIEKIEGLFSQENIILLDDHINWDRLIEIFSRGEMYYSKPIKKEDFSYFL